MDSKTQAPEHYHHRNEILPYRLPITEDTIKQSQRGKPKRPCRINNTSVADLNGKQPDRTHHQTGKDQPDQKK
jgi:hypothetical protein